MRGPGRAGVETPRRVVIDFGGWNVAKEMHIGHLRSTVIGDSLQRLFRFMGDSVTSDVHLGDWGLQMGQLINEVKLEQPDLPYFDASNHGAVSGDEPGFDGRPRAAVSAGVGRNQRRTRRGAMKTARRRRSCRPGGRAIARCGGISAT